MYLAGKRGTSTTSSGGGPISSTELSSMVFNFAHGVVQLFGCGETSGF